MTRASVSIILLLSVPTSSWALTKCVGDDGKVTYQDRVCPPTSRAQPLKGTVAADEAEAEAVWQRGEAAIERADLAELRKVLTKDGVAKLDAMDAQQRQAQLDSARDRAPRNARITGKANAPDGALILQHDGESRDAASGAARKLSGTTRMVREGTAWKMGEPSWKPALTGGVSR
jgi:hypothetical protein